MKRQGEQADRLPLARERQDVQAAVLGVVAGEGGEGGSDRGAVGEVQGGALAHGPWPREVGVEWDFGVLVGLRAAATQPRHRAEHVVGVEHEHHGRGGAQALGGIADEGLGHLTRCPGAGQLHGERVEQFLGKVGGAAHALLVAVGQMRRDHGGPARDHAAHEPHQAAVIRQAVVVHAGGDRRTDRDDRHCRGPTGPTADRGEDGCGGVHPGELLVAEEVDDDSNEQECQRRTDSGRAPARVVHMRSC